MKISPESEEWARYGRDLSISCTFSSKYHESVQLYHNDSLAHVSDQVTITSDAFTDVDGQQTTRLRYMKSNINFDDAGMYECRADNARKGVKINVVKGIKSNFVFSYRLGLKTLKSLINFGHFDRHQCLENMDLCFTIV